MRDEYKAGFNEGFFEGYTSAKAHYERIIKYLERDLEDAYRSDSGA